MRASRCADWHLIPRPLDLTANNCPCIAHPSLLSLPSPTQPTCMQPAMLSSPAPQLHSRPGRSSPAHTGRGNKAGGGGGGGAAAEGHSCVRLVVLHAGCHERAGA